MNQMEWQKKVIREDYVGEREVDDRAIEIYRLWKRKGISGMGKKQRSPAAAIGRTKHQRGKRYQV